MSGFPKLVPAFTAHVTVDTPTPAGALSRGGALIHVVIQPEVSTIRSEPGYPIQLDAVFVHGSDFIRTDADGCHVRLDVASLARDKASGAFVGFKYTGIVGMTGANGKVLRGDPDAKTSEFGEAFASVSFESGSAELAALQDKVFVSSGRFILEEGKPVVVEYKISEVVG